MRSAHEVLRKRQIGDSDGVVAPHQEINRMAGFRIRIWQERGLQQAALAVKAVFRGVRVVR